PRGYQDVQAPRENQEAKTPRSLGRKNARENQDAQSPGMISMANAQDVRAAQVALKMTVFDPHELDGRMVPHTTAANSSFQRTAPGAETPRRSLRDRGPRRARPRRRRATGKRRGRPRRRHCRPW